MKLILCGGGWAEKTVIPNKVFESLNNPQQTYSVYSTGARP